MKNVSKTLLGQSEKFLETDKKCEMSENFFLGKVKKCQKIFGN